MGKSKFKLGDVVCLKSAPYIALTVQHVHEGEKSFWLSCIFYDEETRTFKPMGIKPSIREELFDFYVPDKPQYPPDPVGYKK